MNHGRMIPAITTIIAAAALVTVAFAVPQLAMAHGHNHHYNKSIKVDQLVNQVNQCTGQPPEKTATLTPLALAPIPTPTAAGPTSTQCVNLGSNSADIGH
jgi:hypothetical protein